MKYDVKINPDKTIVNFFRIFFHQKNIELRQLKGALVEDQMADQAAFL
ncbi:hypothetical protein [Peribacillus sp. SCS-37]